MRRIIFRKVVELPPDSGQGAPERDEATSLRLRRGSGLVTLALGWLMTFLGFGITGCQIIPEAEPDPTRYFLLRAPVPPARSSNEGLQLGLRGIEVPAYLRNSRSLVVARGSNEVAYRDYDRWAEPVEAGLSRVFREALAGTHGIRHVNLFPFGAESVDHDYEIALRVLRCEGAETSSGERIARFAVAYRILRGGTAGELVKQGTFVAPDQPWDGEPASLAVLLGEAAAEAAHAIAQELPREST